MIGEQSVTAGRQMLKGGSEVIMLGADTASLIPRSVNLQGVRTGMTAARSGR
jgi:hypothetical protein